MNERVSTEDLVARLRRVGAEPDDVEVKAAVKQLPHSVRETLSAFANGRGGILLLGIAEDEGFTVAEGFDAPRIRDALADACATKVHPPLRVPIEIVPFEGGHVVRVDVDELDPVEKPCFVAERGEYKGSYIRSGDGDQRLTRYEITQLLLNRTQPVFDLEPIARARVDDLDPSLVSTVVAHAVERAPRSFTGLDPQAALRMLGAVTDDGEGPRPTLAGLLCLGTYPQRYFPQLFVSFVALPTTEMGELSPDGARFLDNQTIDGAIPQLVTDIGVALRRNMNRAAIIRGLGREDRYDYPLDVIRELVVNALMHRDYSPESRGAQVQVELYPDRLVVSSPGGLHGGLTADALTSGQRISTSRNAALAKLLADVPMPGAPGETLCENRGSGLVRVMAALRAAGMSPPEFDVSLIQMRVTVPRNALLAPETIAWIGSLDLAGATDEQHLALAMMRNTGSASSGMLQSWGVDPSAAGRALRDLVARGVAVREGGKRYARYHLALTVRAQPELPGLREGEQPPPASGRARVEADLDAVLDAVEAGHVTTRSIEAHLEISYQAALRRVRALLDRGLIEPTRPSRSSKQTYRLTSPEETP